MEVSVHDSQTWIGVALGIPQNAPSEDPPQSSVVSAQADIFAKNLIKIGKIQRIFDELDEIKSQWVLCQS